MKKSLALLSLSALLLAGACGDVTAPLAPPAVSLSSGGGGTALAPVDASINAVVTLKSAARVGENTVFTYEVASNPGDEKTRGPAISHWVLPFLDASVVPVIVASSEKAVFGVDPTTEVRGIKFDTGYGDGEVRTVTLTLAGAWATGAVSAAVKAGNGFKLFPTTGPTSAAAATVSTYAIEGVVFFDADRDGKQRKDADHKAVEPGIQGVVVRIGDKTGVTDTQGRYRFEGLTPAAYGVSHGGLAGMINTLPVSGSQTVEVTDGDAAADFGLQLELGALAGQAANGLSHGFWKGNIDKALKGKTKGMQVSTATLETYLKAISVFALPPFAEVAKDGNAQWSEASRVLSATGSNPVVLLRKQLLASELNYQHGAYIGGDEQLTRLFVWYGEYVADTASRDATAFSAAQILSLKDWFDAYNNTYGGVLIAPAS